MSAASAQKKDRSGTAVVLMDDEMTPYTPGVNCMHCGRFVGRDGWLSYDYFEMSSTLASLEGECRRCIDRHAELVPLVEKILREWDYYDRWLTLLNIRNVIQNGGGETYSADEIFRAVWDSRIRPHIEDTRLPGGFSKVTAYRWKRADRNSEPGSNAAPEVGSTAEMTEREASDG